MPRRPPDDYTLPGLTVPDVGPLTALAFRSTVDQPERFRRSRVVAPTSVSRPRRYESGETDIQGRIRRCGDELARTARAYTADALPEIVGTQGVGEKRVIHGNGHECEYEEAA